MRGADLWHVPHFGSPAFLLTSLTSTSFEANPVAHRCASQHCLALPHDLMSWGWIVFSGAISAKILTSTV